MQLVRRDHKVSEVLQAAPVQLEAKVSEVTQVHQVHLVQLVQSAAQASKVRQVTLDRVDRLALQDQKVTWEAQDRQVSLDYVEQMERLAPRARKVLQDLLEVPAKQVINL